MNAHLKPNSNIIDNRIMDMDAHMIINCGFIGMGIGMIGAMDWQLLRPCISSPHERAKV